MAIQRFFLAVRVLLLFLVTLSCPFAEGHESKRKSITWTVGEWGLRFEPEASLLSCRHALTDAELFGALLFTTEQGDQSVAWSVTPARDSLRERLALVDDCGDVQGYLFFGGSGGTLRIAAIHRSAQSYKGKLTFRAEARLGKQTFACRTRPGGDYRIVQMAAGSADSGLNDSLFDVATDNALRLGGHSVSITTRQPEAAPPTFAIDMTATPHDPAHAALVIEAIQDLYRSQYVPYYKPIDKLRCPSPPTGWMSWNVYFDKAGEKENLDEARVGAKYLKPFGLDIWSIESWQDNSDALPVRKFHNLTLRPNPRQFPHGMKWLAEQIRELGFRPGIWTVPFGTGDQAYYEAHKDWFLHDVDGLAMHNWAGLYLLDPSQAAVHRHMEESHRTMAQEWGYEYFKIDGMSGRNAGYSAHFYERPEVRAAFKEPCEDPFRLCVEALRRGIGPDRIWLACQGHYTGPEIGFADAGRLGADIVHPNQPPHLENYWNQAWTTLNQLFVNNIVWYTDPDTLLVGEAAPLNVARVATTVVGLPGQMMFAGDKLGELPTERMRLLQQCLPVCDVRPLDLFPIFEMAPVWDLKVCRPFANWDVVSLFNWEDEDNDIAFQFDEIGLPQEAEYLVFDFWNQSFLGSFLERFSASVPARSNVLLAVHPALDRPQFLSADRHITQGAISLENISWDSENKVLSGSTHLVADYPSRLVFHVPEGYRFASTEADCTVDVVEMPQPGSTVTLTLRRSVSGIAHWRLQF